MRQQLKDDVPIDGAIPMPSKRGEAHRVRRVVGEIKTAFQGKAGLLCILQTSQAGTQQAGKFVRVGRLGFQRLVRPAEILKCRGNL